MVTRKLAQTVYLNSNVRSTLLFLPEEGLALKAGGRVYIFLIAAAPIFEQACRDD